MAEGPFRNKAPAGTCSGRHRNRPCPAAPAADRSMGQGDTPGGRCTASGRRTVSGHHTVSDRRTAVGRRTASCRRTAACDHRTAAGLQTDGDPGEGKAEDSVHPAEEERNRSGPVALAPRLSGLLGIWGPLCKPSPGTADPIDTTGQEPGRAWAAMPRRLVLVPEGVAFDLRPQEEVGSACLQHYLVVVPPVLFGIRLPFSMTCDV